METINGEWIMLGCRRDDPARLRTVDDLRRLIKEAGFLPLFSNQAAGFSVEERVTASAWWTGDPETDPWEWRQILARDPEIAYGKFFDRKAGFVSKAWFPAFANYRRDGYDFDARYEDGLASRREKLIMDVFDSCEERSGGGQGRGGVELMSFEVKALAGFGRRPDGQSGEKNFEGVMTDLYMKTYLLMSDFRQKHNRRGEAYGWHIAAVEMPETKWSYDFVAAGYREEPEASWGRILEKAKQCHPDAPEAQLRRVLR